MTFSITARSAELYAGLVAPRIQPGAEASSGEWVKFLRDRLREKHADADSIWTVYVPDAHGTCNAVVGIPIASTEDVVDGDVFVAVPTGVYALFTPSGSLANPVEDVWLQVDESSESGEIFRAYKEELEVVTNDGAVQLFISIVM